MGGPREEGRDEREGRGSWQSSDASLAVRDEDAGSTGSDIRSDAGASLAPPTSRQRLHLPWDSLAFTAILSFIGYLWLFSHPFHPRESFAAQQLAPVGSLLHWNRLYLQIWQEPPQGTRPARQQSQSAPSGTAHIKPNAGRLHDPAPPGAPQTLAELRGSRGGSALKSPNPALTARGDALCSGGSRCYHHRCHPRHLVRLLPCAGGSRCRLGIGGTALGLFSTAPGQRLAALPKTPFPQQLEGNRCQTLYRSGSGGSIRAPFS